MLMPSWLWRQDRTAGITPASHLPASSVADPDYFLNQIDLLIDGIPSFHVFPPHD
jgi:hypothetical protein